METIVSYIGIHGNHIWLRKGLVMDHLQLAPIIIGKLLNIGGMLQRHGNRVLMPFGLNQQQFSIFFEIAKARKVKQKEMVNRLLLEKAHVSKVVKKLHTMGLIVITTSGEDRRSSWLAPTPKGKRLLKKCMLIFEKWNKEWLEAIDDKQLNAMLDNLTHLQAVFEDKIKE
jgi:DNA-binding MarR family transcriptional regulator